jgi:hypothetical protein
MFNLPRKMDYEAANPKDNAKIPFQINHIKGNDYYQQSLGF